MISDFEGSFKIKEARITAPKEDFSDATVYMMADVNSIDTDNDEHDKHLRTADFFDVEKFPTLTFWSTSFRKVSDEKYKVIGDLTLHGITKPVTLNVIAKLGTHPMKKKNIAGFKVIGTIKRIDFGIAPSTPSAMLSDEVAIEAKVQFAKD